VETIPQQDTLYSKAHKRLSGALAFLDERRRPLHVELEPVSEEVHGALESVDPHSPETWFSRLSSQRGHPAREKAAIEAVLRGLENNPPGWRIVAATGG
jgi:hypothetical protein